VTLLDDSTDVLPPIAPIESAGGHDERSTPIGLIVVLVLTLLAFAAAALLIAEGIARADVEQSVESQVRDDLSLPATQHVGVSIEGSVLLQGIVNRYETVRVSMPNAPFARSSADVTATLTGVESDERGGWDMERMAAIYSLGSAQATAFYLPEDVRAKMQIGFRGADMTLDASLTSAGRSVPVSVALTPASQGGWVSVALASIAVGGTTVSADDLRARVGDAGLASLQTPPVCVADALPRALSVRDVSVRDQHLLLEVDLDLTLLATPEGRQPGACS
jgi:hypothetical protein